MTSTATVFLATVPAAVTGVLGFGAAWQGGRSARHAADLSHEVEMERLREETRRLRAEREQALRDNRKSTYHQLLAVADELHVLADKIDATGESDVRQQFAAWRQRFGFLVGGALIFGTDQVSDAATQFAEVYRKIAEQTDAYRGAGVGTWIECLRRALADHRAEIAMARENLREAMRGDVGVPRAPEPHVGRGRQRGGA
jgi:hypothetical protein